MNTDRDKRFEQLKDLVKTFNGSSDAAEQIKQLAMDLVNTDPLVKYYEDRKNNPLF